MSNSSRNVRKKTIVNKVAEATGNPQHYTGRVIEEFLAQMIEELSQGNKLEFRGFGVFEPVRRKKKLARNPKTKEEVMVPARTVVKFRMGREMRESMKE